MVAPQARRNGSAAGASRGSAAGRIGMVAPQARLEGSQGRVRSAAQHAAPGSFPKTTQPRRGDRRVPINFCDGDTLVAPSALFLSALAGLRCLFIAIQGLRAARLPLATFSPRLRRYPLAVLSAHPPRRNGMVAPLGAMRGNAAGRIGMVAPQARRDAAPLGARMVAPQAHREGAPLRASEW
jgi:hypothetical protein